MRDLEKIRERRTYRLDGSHMRLLGLIVLLALIGTFYVGMKFGTTQENGESENLALDAEGSGGESQILLMNEPKTHVDAPSLHYESVLGDSGDGGITLAMPTHPSEIPTLPGPNRRAMAKAKPVIPAGAIAATAVPKKGSRGDSMAATARTKATSGARVAMPQMPAGGKVGAAMAQGGYTLQVKAFRTEEGARKFNRELRQNGYDAFVVRSEIPEKGTWYRVRIGQYASLMEATKYQYHFEGKEGLSTFVSPL